MPDCAQTKRRAAPFVGYWKPVPTDAEAVFAALNQTDAACSDNQNGAVTTPMRTQIGDHGIACKLDVRERES